MKNLKAKIEKEILNNEYNIVEIKGIRLSRGDLENALFLLNVLERNGSLNGYMVIGEVKELFDKYGIEY
jgi:hypothetical protein